MSTIKWRQQAFSHLESLLSLRVGRTSPQTPELDEPAMEMEDSFTISPTVDEHEHSQGLVSSDFHTDMYLSTSGLEEITIR